MAERVLLCDCLGSQKIDATAIERATGLTCSRVHTALCTRQIDLAARAIAEDEVIVACGQESQRFSELAADLGRPAPTCVDIRDRAGWGAGGDATAKMAALLAASRVAQNQTKTLDVLSEGSCLILGRDARVFEAADRLAEALAVTVLLTDDCEIPAQRAYEVAAGRIRAATGSLGQFVLTFDALRQLERGGRGAPALGAPRDGAETRCDIVLDLTGGTPLFPAWRKRDGYLRADPGDPGAVAAVVFEAAQHQGTFEKPVHVRLEEHLCAHSRAGKVGCTRCLDNCPTGAITPDGDHVRVDPLICAGCGACSALCPSGAISYDAPPVADVLRQLRALSETYTRAGGTTPRLLVHDAEHGLPMIAFAARFGRGLPPDVLPLEVAALSGFGHAEVLAALAMGFVAADLLVGPRTERPVLEREIALARAMGAGDRVRILDLSDPDTLSDVLYDQPVPAPAPAPVLAMGSRRQVARLAARALMPEADAPVPLPDGAPYGAVLVDTGACTLCLSCASLCPSGALLDNPDKPQLRFQEDACLQCGLCATICPEKAITLVPQFDPSDAALSQKVLNEEEPFACIECGKPFGVKSTIEKIMEKLAGKHPMFMESDAGRLMQMCDDCRVRTQYHGQSNPFQLGERPRVRTTDDYLSKRRDH